MQAIVLQFSDILCNIIIRKSYYFFEWRSTHDDMVRGGIKNKIKALFFLFYDQTGDTCICITLLCH